MAVKGIEIEGLESLKESLTGVAPRVANNILRGYVADYARLLRDRIKVGAPVGETGNLKKSVSARTSRGSRSVIGALVYTKPGGEHWHLIEYGTQPRKTSTGANRGSVKANPFVWKAVLRTRKEFDEEMQARFVKRFKDTLIREHRKRAKK